MSVKCQGANKTDFASAQIRELHFKGQVNSFFDKSLI